MPKYASLILLASLLTLPSTALLGQSTQGADHGRLIPPGRIPVTVVLAEEFPYQDANALIVRARGRGQPDVILLRESTATGEQLAAAVLNLMSIFEIKGDSATADGVFRVRSASAPPNWAETEVRSANGALQRLRAQPIAELSRWGRGRSTTIYLPSRELRELQKQRGRWGVHR